MKKTTKTLMAFLTAMTMTAGAMGVTAYAEENTSLSAEQQTNDDTIRGQFESGAWYSCTPHGLLRVASGFTPDEFYQLVEKYQPRFLWLINTDIFTDENETSEWLKKITSELSFEGVALWYKGSSSLMDKYNKMIDSMVTEAEANGESVTPTDLKFKYKMFFYEYPTGELSGPDGVICKNCHYVNMNEMKAYPNNNGILAAVEAPDHINDENEMIIDENKVLAKAEQIGDANDDGTVNVRDCALIASNIASGKSDSLPNTADYNKDGKKNVRDAAAISKDLANK